MTMQPLEWHTEYCTGIKEIDLQHHYFLELINRLGIELDLSIDKLHQRSLLDELCKYAAFHFVSEENLMHKLNYPGLDDHRELHQKLISELAARCVRDSPGDLVRFLVSWFIHHTVEEDRHIGDYARMAAVKL